ncbi:hypothetical protein CAPTEDRAFT_113791 [Capitella teleta]|uniref:SRCR domain-containing protein n=1 Tax=Capitella teleta TaxID=283909 RepID=R7UCU1_CAPTE|nr:hypothetical protein CAPTEDRAFT_113791 [Capitella teleta]|eukprot:ELU03809.1 hypothetical protein CAPTEDRAFT_113791 [Capitella teleta]
MTLNSKLFLSQAVAAQDVKVRLGNGLNDREGRVEILYDGTWGTICDDGWDVQDAAVICAMVGFSGLARAFTQASPFGPGSGPIHLSQVECDGNEQSISFCSHAGWDNNRCTHAEDAGVSCLGVRVSNNPSTDIRLVDGPNDAAGRVQVRDKNRWYAVCDDFWDLNDAAVVCRMLCYNPINARAHIGGAYGNTTEEFLLDDVMCSGDETDLMDCPNAGLSNSDCDYAEGAGVSCLQDTPTPPPCGYKCQA